MVTFFFKVAFLKGVVTVARLSKKWMYVRVDDRKKGREEGGDV